MYLPTPTYEFSSPMRGWVKHAIAPQIRGRVKYEASYWPAELHAIAAEVTLQPNEEVQVLGRRGLVLLVAPLNATRGYPKI